MARYPMVLTGAGGRSPAKRMQIGEQDIWLGSGDQIQYLHILSIKGVLVSPVDHRPLVSRTNSSRR